MSAETLPRCPACLEHPGWAHGDTLRRREPADACRACFGSGVEQPKRIRETCTECGMVANLDPDLHQERYDHAPTVQRGRIRERWSTECQLWLPVPMAEYRSAQLVSEFAELRTLAYTDRAGEQHARLGFVVDELRLRGLLDS